MKSSILRQFWTLVEEIQLNTFLKLSDTDLSKQLLRLLEDKQSLSREESQMMDSYIHSRILLIRELCESQLAHA